ncbi:MAG TPA: prepilin-type N-terminal cleavage/methylation domain-containing protein [Nitriliruptorales bacterium]
MVHRTASRDDAGFTLIELLVVVIIIGILAAIAIPVFLNQREKARNGAARSDLRNLITAQEAYLTEKDAYTEDGASLAAEQGGLTVGVEHAVCVDDTDDQHYLMGAKHVNGDKLFYFDNLFGAIDSFDPVPPDEDLLGSWPDGAACVPGPTF